ncbi:hypothetical protein [Wenxinia marina]|uniref:Uncharacterized protein n=1 Tax=Wenxinia marina DSM 24838 TaxID=1123501 RepID=A0A0D0Q5A9_9RHOB|nr:hypothetical protein [Wenxinia marina]KIQ69684.1 hypothetical protein Wenmar_02048 [Wenxinia marina DSM 24838]GGL60337.1 hypothetical protein GCM10011392_13550 [Wenxinia marina]
MSEGRRTARPRLSPALPHRRTVLHWLLAPLAPWFAFLDPGEPLPDTRFWRLFQSNLAPTFVSGALLRIGLYAATA